MKSSGTGIRLRRRACAFAVGFVVLCSITACGDESPQPTSGPVDPGTNYLETQIPVGSFTAQEANEAMGNDPMLGAMLAMQPSKKVAATDIFYHTTDPHGNAVTASGIVYYPADRKPNGWIVAEHGTIFSEAETPSRNLVQVEGLFAFAGYAVIVPDLIGFHDTADLPHPYLHAASAAQVTADMVFAVREYMVRIAGIPLKGPMYVMGYSQGGHSALAFQRLAEHKYAKELPLKTVFAGAGPYDLTGTFEEFIRTDYTSYPCSIPYIALGLDYGDDLGLDFTRIFKEPLLSNYPEWYGSRVNDAYAINELLGTTRISDFMHSDLFATTSELKPDVVKLRASLERNSLLDWTPRAPVRLFHGEEDTVVPLLNSENACQAFKARGCDVRLKTVPGDHGSAAMQFYLYVFNELK